MTFRVIEQQLEFRAVDRVYFPPNKAGNILRGAFGILSSPLPAPAAHGASGLAEPPRPFVFRAAHLDGQTFDAGETFWFGLNIFDLRGPLLTVFTDAFAELERTGLGPGRARVKLMPHKPYRTLGIELEDTRRCDAATINFRTPTELKGNTASDEIPFHVLFARLRDRIATLASLYGQGSVPVDFKALGMRAAAVSTLNSDLQFREVARTSSRTGQTHGIGGLTGSVDYTGDMGEFIPWLKAGYWTGVGRHAVWGNGVIECVTRDCVNRG